jgi:hypothetical protein
MPPKTSNLSNLVEKLFLALLVGSCSFMTVYLRDINASITKMQDRVGFACEQISFIDASIKSIGSMVNNHEARIQSLSRKHGG